MTDSRGPTPATAGLRDGLQALGYREDEHYHLGVRFTQGDVAAVPAAARDLLAAGSDVIFTTSAHGTIPAQQATSVNGEAPETIPVEMNSRSSSRST